MGPNPAIQTDTKAAVPMTTQLRHNLRALRFDRHELAGALGDLGTFIPLFVGMVSLSGLHAGSALFFAGLFNILTGVMFGLPMAVQPMKAIATVAISEGLTNQQLLAAGLITSAVIFLFGITRLIETLNRLIPMSVVRGVQLGLGLQLLMTGIQMIAHTGRVWGHDSIFVGVAGGLLVLFLFFSRRFPGALIVFVLGLILLGLQSPAMLQALRVEWSGPGLVAFSRDDFLQGGWRAALPQIPLTTLNSVIAVGALSWDLFPNRGAHPRDVAVSVGLMNLVGCWFGAMPMCHGAGGLAGQYRFGARTGGSVVALGVVKMVLGLFVGGSIVTLLSAYPQSILGVLLLFSGMELALVTRDMRAKTDWFIVLLTAAVILAVKSTAIGFVVGFSLAFFFYRGVLRIEREGDGGQ
jgi:MFS superfamily sulfate permease-like transporter